MNLIPEKVAAREVALVTGAGRGIGAAIAHSLAGMGKHLVLCGRSSAPLEQTAAAITQAGGSAQVITCDVTRLPAVEGLAQELEQSCGRLDILVNNAGVGGFHQPLHELPPQAWEEILNTNLRGVFYCIRCLAPMMIRARAGHIINISSLAGKNPLPLGAAYAASKWGLNGLSYSVAEELRAYGVRVSVVAPGSVATDLAPRAGRDLSKMLRPEDVAHVVGMLVTQAPGSFASEVLLRPTTKP